MTQRGPVSVDDMISELCQLGDLRVWSVIITIFGDAVMPRGGVVPASVLAAITERLSIKPEAMRVALYRLVKDGWVTRRKTGRNSFYALSDSGRKEFLSATRRIYATGPELSGPWRLAGLPPMPESRRQDTEKTLRKSGFLPLTSRLFLGPAQAKPAPAKVFLIEGSISAAPGWSRDALAPDALQADYVQLESALLRCQSVLSKSGDPGALDTVALRILLIHRWRRLLLRHADLPLEVLPKSWRGEVCRTLVLSLHDQLSPVADLWLDTAIGPLTHS